MTHRRGPILALVLVCAFRCAAHAEPVRIVAFGDSNTAGYLVPPAQAYPAQLQAALRQRGFDVAVTNAGMNGDTTSGALARFDAAIGPDTRIAIVEFGVNDLRRGATFTAVSARLTTIVRALRKRGIAVLLIGAGVDLAPVAAHTGVPYVQWQVAPHKYRARDGHHLDARGYAMVVAQMLPAVEKLLKGAAPPLNAGGIRR